MSKPKPKTVKLLDWHECTDFINKKYSLDTRDVEMAHRQFSEWHEAKGYPETDAEGKSRGESQVWFSEYKAEVRAGKIIERPYHDFWHWLTDVADIHRGGMLELSKEMADDAEPWVKRILVLYLTEFGNGPYLTDW